jgi:hypothetical protein
MMFHSLPLALLCLALGACSWAPYLPIEASLLQLLAPRYTWLILVFGEPLGKVLDLIFSCPPSPRLLGVV